MTWWTTEPDFQSSRVIVFQVDLAGHSSWVEEASTDAQPAHDRATFAATLEGRLTNVGFDRLLWAGDGGVFVKRYSGRTSDADSVCLAAREAFDYFVKWKRPEWALTLRATATYVPNLITSRDPGQWISPRFNAFLKYERDIARPSAFVITDDLRRLMNYADDCFNHFATRCEVSLPNGEAIMTWIDNRYPGHVEESPRRFISWLRRQSFKRTNEVPHASGVQVGESIVLNSALSISGYERIELALAESVPDFKLSAGEFEEWTKEKGELTGRGISGTRLRVVSFHPEGTDDPVFRISWRPMPYVEVRAFHRMVEKKDEFRRRYLPAALTVEQDKTWIPNTLACQIVVLVKNGHHGRDLILAHRPKLGRTGTYQANCWFSSLGEQFNPVAEKRGGKDYPRDIAVRDAVIRGVKEELVGTKFDKTMRVSIQAFHLETWVLNYALLAIVDLPETTFEDIKSGWVDAPDFGEHDALAALPATADLLRRCMESDRLPEDIWDRIEKAGRIDLEHDDHRWSEADQTRRALALWYTTLGEKG